MEVDPPPLSGSQPDITAVLPPLNPLKRSNSAPMINMLVSSACSSSSPPTIASSIITQPVAAAVQTNNNTITSSSMFSSTFPRQFERIRRYSTSSTSLHSPSTPVKIAPQLDRLKREETSNPKEREAAHENKVQSHMQLSSSWESLHLGDPVEEPPQPMQPLEPRRPKSFQEPLHIFTSPYPFASSPSPTRIGKQCFSPSLQQPVRTLGGNLTPSPSPSPTRKTFVRRSMSPIALRPSPLGASLKRKMDSESDRMDYHSSPKRLQMTYSPVSSSTASADRNNLFSSSTGNSDKNNLFSHPLMQSSASSSCSSSDETSTSQNGMLPPSPLHLAEAMPCNVIASSTASFTCRSPVPSSSAAAFSSSSSPSLLHSSPVVASSSMDSSTSTPQPMQTEQHNTAFRNAFHGQFPAISSGDFNRLHPHHPHHHHHHHGHHLQQQQQQQHNRSTSPSLHHPHHPHHQQHQQHQQQTPHIAALSSHHHHHHHQRVGVLAAPSSSSAVVVAASGAGLCANSSSSSSSNNNSSSDNNNIVFSASALRRHSLDHHHHTTSSSSSSPRVISVSSSTPPAAASVFGTFRPVVRDSVDSVSAMSTGGTDSEEAETTDLSETSDANTSANMTEVHTPSPTLFNLPSKTNVRS